MAKTESFMSDPAWQQEGRLLRHDLRNQVQAVKIGLQLLRAAMTAGDDELLRSTLAQLHEAVDELEKNRFIQGDWPAQLRSG